MNPQAMVERETKSNPLFSNRYRRLVAQLRKARLDAGLKQEDVAAVFGKPQSWISRLENQKRKIDWIEMEDLAALYRRPLKYFETRTSQPGPSKGHRHRG